MRVLVLLAVLSLPARPCPATPPADSGQGALLDSFEQYPLLTFPSQWHVRGNDATARLIYQVTEEHGDRFLHAHAEGQAIQIGLVHGFALAEYPRLRWRWRVTQLPTAANEARKETHDSAAGVYVLFDNRLLPRIIKYVWSTTLPVGTTVQNPLYWRAKIVVLESGRDGLGHWRQETVNVAQDYRTLFGQEPGSALGIGLSSSASFTQSQADADYDDFTLLPMATDHAERPVSPAATSGVALRQ